MKAKSFALQDVITHKIKKMSTELTTKKLPELKDLVNDLQTYQKQDELNFLTNQEPPKKWVKTHPYIANHKYIPIDKVEYLLKRIFKRYRIEITGQGTSFNGVYVTVRVHFLNPINNEWDFHDGIGAIHLQTKKGSSPADLQNINNGALSMAYPLAKTLAVKDACDHFGSLFGANLNRKDVLPASLHAEIMTDEQKNFKDFVERIDNLEDLEKAKTNPYAKNKEIEPLIQLKEIQLRNENKN